MTETPPAKITDRFLAYLVDIVPFFAGYYVTLYTLIVKTGRLPNTVETWRTAAIAWIVVYLLYETFGNAMGQTLGKKVFGIQVIALDGTRLGFGRSFLRALGYFVSTPLMNLGFLWSLFEPRSRTWHDLMAGSMVIDRNPKPPAVVMVTAVASLSGVFLLLVGNVWFYLFRQTPADQAAVRKAEQGLEVLAQIQEAYKARNGRYSSDLVELARTSGDIDSFRDAMGEIFKKDAFLIRADEDSFVIQARARDPRGTIVTKTGP